MRRLVFLCIFLVSRTRAQLEGEECMDKFSNTTGQCTAIEHCQTAKEDFQRKGIRPTFCSLNITNVIVCCTKSDSSRRKKPVSERKCEEYTRREDTIDYLPLNPFLPAQTIKILYHGPPEAPKCGKVEVPVGGKNACQGEFPHMAAIGWADDDGSYKFLCGGSLISPRFVVTAGRCTQNRNAQNPEPVLVRLGDQNIDDSVNDGADPLDIVIRKIHKHPDYNPPRPYDDIALLELASDVKFHEAVRPACLWTKPDFNGYDKAVAVGWGVVDSSTRESSKELHKTLLSLLDNDNCEKLLASTRPPNWSGFRPSQLCASELRTEKETCQADFGSPLQLSSKENPYMYHLIGIASPHRGNKCSKIGVYTRVASYIDWIESVVWPGE